MRGQDLSVRMTAPGRRPVRLGLLPDLRWSTVAPGGFGSASGTVRRARLGDIPHLSRLEIDYGEVRVFEGQVEDPEFSSDETGSRVFFTAYGYARLLDEASVRRLWSKRDWPWEAVNIAAGSDGGGTALAKRGDFYSIRTGNYDPADQTKSGVEIRGAQNSGTASDGDCHQVEIIAPAGMTFTRLKCDVTINGSNHRAMLHSSADGSSWTLHAEVAATGSIDQALVADATAIRLSFGASAAQALTTTIYGQFSNIRVLGTSLDEDTAGGFYVSSILADLLTFTPALAAGTIEQGTDAVIRQLERITRSTVRDVIDEITRVSSRVWAVWDGPRLDWATAQREQPSWVATLAECRRIRLRSSVDGHARTVYVNYTDPKDGRQKESSSTSTDRRNPYVRLDRTKDAMITAPAAVVEADADTIAATAADQTGRFPTLSGTITLPLAAVIRRAAGRGPAATIRAGDTILVPDLPKDDLFSYGRDSQTVFYIVSTDADNSAGMITLTVESHQPTLDVVLARLAAANL